MEALLFAIGAVLGYLLGYSVGIDFRDDEV
jgi:hypothetical protein